MPEFGMGSIISRKNYVYRFWDSQGQILEDCQERVIAMNSVHHSDGSGAFVDCHSTKNTFSVLRAYKKFVCR
jgi:hypothetical protein